MTLSTKGLLAIAGGVATVLTAAPASAQFHERNRNQSVRERPQPGYDPTGIPVGAFRVYATIPIGVAHTSNVFATPDGEEDTILTAHPNVNIQSQWSQHALSASADLEQENYSDFDDENRTNFTLAGNGRLDIRRGFFANLNVSQGWLQEARTNASTPPNTISPTEYDQFQASLDLSREFNRLRLSGGAGHYEADYDNSILNDGSNTVVLQDDRDHKVFTLRGRADYAITPATAVFAAVSTTRRDYDLQPIDNPGVILFSRDAEGYTYSLGTDFDVTQVMRGQVSLGYLKEDFLDPVNSDIDGLAAQARVEWFPSPVATLELSARRSVTETGVIGAAAALSTEFGARVDYEVRRNVILTGQLNHRNDEYEGIARDDDSLAAALDVVYLINRNVGASVTLQHTERDSSGAGAGPEFDQDILGVNLILRR